MGHVVAPYRDFDYHWIVEPLPVARRANIPAPCQQVGFYPELAQGLLMRLIAGPWNTEVHCAEIVTFQEEANFAF